MESKETAIVLDGKYNRDLTEKDTGKEPGFLAGSRQCLGVPDGN